MSYDPKVPSRLAHIQRWFGSTITQDMQYDLVYEEQPSAYITSTDTLNADERMQLYHQSYWLRLLGALQEQFPFLSRLFGKHGFNAEIAIPYFVAHPPSHWSLHVLGKDVVSFLEKSYEASDKALVIKAAEIDWACQACFFAKSLPAIDLLKYAGDKAEELLYKKLKIQPHVHILAAHGHFMHFREAFLQHDHDYWLNHDFPTLEKKEMYFILYRAHHLNVVWETLEPGEFALLKLLQEGYTLDTALEQVEESEEIPFWLQKWLLNNWLSDQD